MTKQATCGTRTSDADGRHCPVLEIRAVPAISQAVLCRAFIVFTATSLLYKQKIKAATTDCLMEVDEDKNLPNITD